MQYFRKTMIVRILLISLIVQTIVFLGVTVAWRCKRNILVTETRVCSACDDLLTRREIANGTLGVVARLVSADNDKMCCGEAGEVLELAARKSVIDKFFENLIGSVPVKPLCQAQDRPETPQGLVVGVVNISKTQFQGSHRLLWNKNTRTRTSGGLMHLEEEGELFIRRSGKYFVSARLHLVSNTSSPVDDAVTLQMSVLSHELGYSRVILAIRRSFWDENAWSKPVQFGALFDFYEYDRLSLSITHPNLVAINSNNDQFIATFHQ